MSAVTARRLRPGRIAASGAHVWLVDSERPVAAVVAADGSVRLMHWPEGEREYWQGRTVAPDGVGIVTQVGSVVTWVRPDGSKTTGECECDLAAADSEFAWFVDGGEPNYQLDGEWAYDSADHDDTGRLLALAPDGSQHSFEAPQPVTGVQIDGDRVIVNFAEQPRLVAGYRMDYPTSQLRLSRDELLADGLVHIPVRQPSPELDEDEDDYVGTTGDDRDCRRGRVLGGDRPPAVPSRQQVARGRGHRVLPCRAAHGSRARLRRHLDDRSAARRSAHG